MNLYRVIYTQRDFTEYWIVAADEEDWAVSKIMDELGLSNDDLVQVNQLELNDDIEYIGCNYLANS